MTDVKIMPKCCRADCLNPVAHAERAPAGAAEPGRIEDHIDFFCVAHVQWGLDRFRSGYQGHAAFCPDTCRKLLIEHGLTPTEQCLDCAQSSTQFTIQQQSYAGSFTRRDLYGGVIEWCCQKMAMTDLTRAIRNLSRGDR